MEAPSSLSGSEWNAIIENLPGAHVLQTWNWGQVKARVGWQAFPRIWRDPSRNVRAAALVLQRSLNWRGFTTRVMYVPKGPLLNWNDAGLRRCVLDDLQLLARQQRAIFIKIDPDVHIGNGIPGSESDRPDPLGMAVQADLKQHCWRFSPEQIQFRNTVLINLRQSEEELLKNMKQKTRYNIRLAEKRGVVVRVGTENDLKLLYRMYAETSLRDDFVIRDEGYYRRVWSEFMQAGLAEALIAESSGEAVGALVVFHFGGRAVYMYGMSTQDQREKMPNYLLQWEAIRRAKAAGCSIYDLWGAPDRFDESDPMWGVFRFKEGLGGEVTRTLGAWDLPIRPVFYRLYTQGLPRLLELMRKRGRVQTARQLGPQKPGMNES